MSRTHWFWRPRQLNSQWAEVRSFSSPEYPHPSTIDGEDRPTKHEPVYSSFLDTHENLVVEFSEQSEAFSAPPLWFVVHEAPSPFPNGPSIPHTIIYPMYGDDFAYGTIVTDKKLLEIGIPITQVGAGSSERVGFTSFARKTSTIQQVFVSEKWRRKRITVAMFSVADLVIVSSRRDTYLNGGEITTSDGEELRKFWASSRRVNPRAGSVDKI